jgi:hypothetical protein
MKLVDVIQAIETTKIKRDFIHELTPANKEILSRRNGTFEAVLTGRGDEKCLIPEVGVLHYLYRGQNEEFVPCVPTIYRELYAWEYHSYRAPSFSTARGSIWLCLAYREG